LAVARVHRLVQKPVDWISHRVLLRQTNHFLSLTYFWIARLGKLTGILLILQIILLTHHSMHTGILNCTKKFVALQRHVIHFN